MSVYSGQYHRQCGGELPYYIGNKRRQIGGALFGTGLRNAIVSNVIKTVGSALKPHAKRVGKQAIKAGVGTVADVIFRKKNIKDAVMDHGERGFNKLTKDYDISALPTPKVEAASTSPSQHKGYHYERHY